ncbi:hypothetical protein G7K_2416-t1 [Saitoella complicata NRRL Y-17804]|uniref:Anaphase-promoting complex subunit 4 WD40 domain-containing protein n=1 Tax=Saitoella complicata (strain BCRC 22490 / CBS 7301 / JCM 7358 / NBRC 10748 / NRRL Y-17804) TaxID=698492 RepID=A0A0E9NEU3_SAICN|nr:hypothetical protein G7K_2416-t1 [Saitoella complicata NRRL Y-17804]
MQLSKRLLTRESIGNGDIGSVHSIYGAKSWVERLDIQAELEGHFGCVNALTWSSDGELLASGSDDTRIVIWDATNNFAQKKVIQTGHTQNIFSVKFMPHTGNRTLVSCAGDSEVRVFDIDYDGPRSYDQSSASQVFRCHQDRAKRIVCENSPYTFLTCSEDGDVRQFDLRAPQHRCERGSDRECAPPLLSYRSSSIDLNTITLSKQQPQYFVVGGAHLQAFLHDRRMIGRDMRREWGDLSYTPTRSTQCVRRFSPNGEEMTRRGSHITACKLGDANPRELVGSWSADFVYMFDIHGDPVDAAANSRGVRTSTAPRRGPANGEGIKRKRTQSQDVDDVGESSTTRPRDESPEDVEEPTVQVGVLSQQSFLEPSEGRTSSRAHPTTPRSRSHGPPPYVADPPDYVDTSALPDRVSALRAALFAPEPEYPAARDLAFDIAKDMRSLLTSGPPPSNRVQRNMALKFVRACGAIAHTIAQPNIDSQLLSIQEGWSWRYDFIRAVLGWLADPKLPVEPMLPEYPPEGEDEVYDIVRGDEVVFSSEWDMARAFVRMATRQPLAAENEEPVDEEGGSRPLTPSDAAKRFWTNVCRSLVRSEGEGIDYGFLMAAWRSTAAEDLEEDVDGDGDSEEEEEEEEEEEREGDIMSSEDEDADEDDDDDRIYGGRQPESGVPIVGPTKRFSGHCNVQTVKDVNFYGLDDEYVVSGSDDGHLFIWDKKTTRIVNILKGDGDVVNVAQGHPYTPMIAVSGIDNTVKLFSPAPRLQGLNTRRALHKEYQICATNEMHRQQGMQHTVLTRSMMASLARRIRVVRQGEAADGVTLNLDEENCRIM